MFGLMGVLQIQPGGQTEIIFLLSDNGFRKRLLDLSKREIRPACPLD